MSVRTFPLVLALAAAASLLAPAPARAGDATPAGQLAETHADTIVSIRFVLKMRISMMGQTQEEEASREVRGVLVDASGLVLTANDHFSGGAPGGLLGMLGSQMEIEAAPSDIKVLFGREEKEYDARLVAKDSDLGLAFLQVEGLGDRAVKALDLSVAGEARLGQDLLGLSRMARAFDCAALVDRLHVVARVERPRALWAVEGSFAALGMPVFGLDGKPVGILTMSQGSEGVSVDPGSTSGLMGLLDAAGATSRFVLPLSAVTPVLERALARAKSPAAAPADVAPEDGAEGEK